MPLIRPPSFRLSCFLREYGYCLLLPGIRRLDAVVVSFFTAGFRGPPIAAYCPPMLLGAASAPVGVDRWPFLNVYALRLFNVSDGFRFFLAFLALTVVLTPRVVGEEFRDAVCAEANTAKPMKKTVDIITRFIIIPLRIE